jgi:hypothetical protein
MSLVSFFRDKIKAGLTPQNEAVIEVSIIDPNNPNNRIIPDSNGRISISSIISTASTEVTQNTHDDLNANATLQIGDVDVPGGAGVVSASTPRITLASNDPAVTELASILSQLDITLSALRDGLRGASTKDFSTVESDIETMSGKLPGTLGQKASAASLAAVLSTEQEAVFNAIKTAVELIDNAVSGTALTVRLNDKASQAVGSQQTSVDNVADVYLAEVDLGDALWHDFTLEVKSVQAAGDESAKDFTLFWGFCSASLTTNAPTQLATSEYSMICDLTSGGTTRYYMTPILQPKARYLAVWYDCDNLTVPLTSIDVTINKLT